MGRLADAGIERSVGRGDFVRQRLGGDGVGLFEAE